MGDSSDQLTQLLSTVQAFMAQQTAIAERHQEAITALSKRLDDLSSTPAHDHACSSQAAPPPPAIVRPEVAPPPRPTRLDFPTYDGKTDPLSWLTRCEQFFRHQQISAAERLPLASFHLLDSALLWGTRLLTDKPGITWTEFKSCCNLRFGPPIRSNPLGALTTLRQTGSVDDYLDQFQLLLAHVPLPPDMQVAIFTAGLGDRLRLDVEFEAPGDLVTAMSLARICDRRLQLAQEAYVPCPAAPPERLKGPATPQIRQLSSAEMNDRRARGLCFNCDEQYTRGHRCKRLFYLQVLDSDSDEEGVG